MEHPAARSDGARRLSEMAGLVGKLRRVILQNSTNFRVLALAPCARGNPIRDDGLNPCAMHIWTSALARDRGANQRGRVRLGQQYAVCGVEPESLIERAVVMPGAAKIALRRQH